MAIDKYIYERVGKLNGVDTNNLRNILNDISSLLSRPITVNDIKITDSSGSSIVIIVDELNLVFQYFKYKVNSSFFSENRATFTL